MSLWRSHTDDALRHIDFAVWVLCALAATFGGWALHVGWHHSILDLHPWRQSHTALSAYEMVRGGPFWHYVTPILGPPWPSPIEMPLYQRIVATLSTANPGALHETGRAVSVAFFLATLVSGWFALDLLEVRPRYRPVFVALAMASPLYLFWSRTFMIESTALFFAVTFLLAVHRATKTGVTPSISTAWWTFALVVGVIGGMVKVTTFVPWWTGAAVLAAARMWRNLAPRGLPRATSRGLPGVSSRGLPRALSRGRLAIAAAALIVPVLAAAWWLAFSGAVKAQNPLSARLAWSTVAWQHFGPLAMRLDPRSWYMVPGGTVLGRTRHAVVGSGLSFAAAWLAIVLLGRRVTPMFVCVALYVLPIAIFMHLYTAHVYYSYANGLLLLVMVGCGIVALLEHRGWLAWLGLGVLAWTLVAMTGNYLRGYYVDQQSDDVSRWPLASQLGRQVPRGDVLLIYGLDLNTEFMYTARRRAIQSWEDRGAGDPLFERSLALLAQEGSRVGALVACGDSRGLAVIPATAQRLSIAERPSYRDVYCDVYFPRDRMPATDVRFH